LLAVLLTAAALVYHTLDGVFWQITSPRRYASIAGEYRRIAADRPAHTDLMAVFPTSLPPEARNTRFSYWTPPGDVSLQLRCTLPAADVAEIVARWAPAALSTTRGPAQESGYYHGPTDDHQFFVGNGPGGWHLPETYVVYTTAVGHEEIDATSRNSYEVGVAVDDKQNDVIYWMQGHAEPAPAAATSASASHP
jgi:hypothetical protein